MQVNKQTTTKALSISPEAKHRRNNKIIDLAVTKDVAPSDFFKTLLSLKPQGLFAKLRSPPVNRGRLFAWYIFYCRVNGSKPQQLKDLHSFANNFLKLDREILNATEEEIAELKFTANNNDVEAYFQQLNSLKPSADTDIDSRGGNSYRQADLTAAINSAIENAKSRPLAVKDLITLMKYPKESGPKNEQVVPQGFFSQIYANDLPEGVKLSTIFNLLFTEAAQIKFSPEQRIKEIKALGLWLKQASSDISHHELIDLFCDKKEKSCDETEYKDKPVYESFIRDIQSKLNPDERAAKDMLINAISLSIDSALQGHGVKSTSEGQKLDLINTKLKEFQPINSSSKQSLTEQPRAVLDEIREALKLSNANQPEEIIKQLTKEVANISNSVNEQAENLISLAIKWLKSPQATTVQVQAFYEATFPNVNLSKQNSLLIKLQKEFYTNGLVDKLDEKTAFALADRNPLTDNNEQANYVLALIKKAKQPRNFIMLWNKVHGSNLITNTKIREQLLSNLKDLIKLEFWQELTNLSANQLPKSLLLMMMKELSERSKPSGTSKLSEKFINVLYQDLIVSSRINTSVNDDSEFFKYRQKLFSNLVELDALPNKYLIDLTQRLLMKSAPSDQQNQLSQVAIKLQERLSKGELSLVSNIILKPDGDWVTLTQAKSNGYTDQAISAAVSGLQKGYDKNNFSGYMNRLIFGTDCSDIDQDQLNLFADMAHDNQHTFEELLKIYTAALDPSWDMWQKNPTKAAGVYSSLIGLIQRHPQSQPETQNQLWRTEWLKKVLAKSSEVAKKQEKLPVGYKTALRSLFDAFIADFKANKNHYDCSTMIKLAFGDSKVSKDLDYTQIESEIKMLQKLFLDSLTLETAMPIAHNGLNLDSTNLNLILIMASKKPANTENLAFHLSVLKAVEDQYKQKSQSLSLMNTANLQQAIMQIKKENNLLTEADFMLQKITPLSNNFNTLI